MRSKEPVFIYDARLIQRHVKEGKVRESELTAYLQSLPDSSWNAESLEPDSGVEGKPARS
jgi:hypothetical protein